MFRTLKRYTHICGAFRVFAKDLFQFLANAQTSFLVLALPVFILFLVGQLRTQLPDIRMLVAGTPADKKAQETLDIFLAGLKASKIKVSRMSKSAFDPLAQLDGGHFDFLLNAEGKSGYPFFLYTAETNPYRLTALQQVAAGLERMLLLSNWAIKERLPEELKPYVVMYGLGTFSLRSVFSFYPQAADPSISLIPMTIAFIICFLPFVVSAPSLIREKEAHTLEVLMTAPRIGPASLFFGKCILPLTISVFQFLLMLLVSQFVFHVHVKIDPFPIILVLLLALLSSTLLGLAISSLANSQSQTMAASASYFFGLTLLTGFYYPIDEGSNLIRALSKLFPLTFLRPSLEAWMFGAQSIPNFAGSVQWLSFQCALFGILAGLSYCWTLRRI